MKNIIVLLIESIDYDSRVQKEISNFIKLGYEVTLFLWNWEPYKFKKERVRIVDAKLSRYVTKDKKFTFLIRFLKFIRYWHLASKEIKKENIDFIHCNDLITLGVLFFLPRRFYKKVIYDDHDLTPERYKRKGIKYYIWTRIEKTLIRKVDTVIVPEINRGRYLKEKYKLPKMPWLINNYPIYQTINTINIKKELKLPNNSILLCYQGIIDKGRDIENMILSLKYIPERYTLLLIGYEFAFGDYIFKLKKLVMQEQLENRVFFYGKVSPDKLLQTVAGCDISIALYQNNGINNYFCASNKVFDSIMAGVKVITNDYPPHKNLRGYEFIDLISNINPRSLAFHIMQLAKSDTEIPDSIKKQFSWDSLFDVFREIYN